MSYKINEVFEPEKVAMRDIYCSTLMDMAETDKRIVVLDADLANSIGIRPFAKKYPDRFFNCGVQEANMMALQQVCGNGKNSVCAYIRTVCLRK